MCVSGVQMDVCCHLENHLWTESGQVEVQHHLECQEKKGDQEDPEACSLLQEDRETESDQEVSQALAQTCLLYTSPSPRDGLLSRMPSSA